MTSVQTLTGRVALVTGATSGIGRAVALGLAAEGATVVCTGRNQTRGADVHEAITSQGGKGAYLAADVSRADECRRLVDQVVADHGRLDILVNSAGAFPIGSALEVSEDDFNNAMETNVRGTFFCGQAALRHMVDRAEGGRIINIASVAGLVGFAGAALYVATKGAILALTKAWAVEFAPNGILVNAIAPGNIETPMNEHLLADSAYDQAMIERTPSGRHGRVEDIVPAAVLLAGDGGAYFCGSTLVIDGGWSAQ